MQPLAPTLTRPATVALVTPHQIVAIGLAAMLAGPPDIRLVDPTSGDDPDVVLYDVIGLLEGDTDELDRWIKETGATVVGLSRSLRPDLGALALEHGVAAVVDLHSSAEAIVSVVLSACAGTLEENAVARAAEQETRLGDPAGLSPREIDVLRLMVLGLRNQEIAEQLFISINSVKSYIRSAYRKIGVTTRPQAVSWCVRHGFPPAVA